MKHARKLLALILSLAMCASLMTACGGSDSKTPAATEGGTAAAEATEPAGSDEAEPAEEGGTVDANGVIHWQLDVLVDTMDVTLSNDMASCGVLSQVIEGLYTKDPDGTVILAMADSVDKSEDGLTYTYHIREDAYWSNGDPVRAQDFEFSWKRCADPATASDYQWFIQNACIKNADPVVAGEMDPSELGVTATDDKTLVVELSVPCGILENILISTNFSPIQQEFFEKCGDSYATSADTILCNGPFVITDYQPSAMTISAVKNESYYNADQVALEGIQWQIIQDSQTAAMSYSNGDLDVVTIAGSQVEQYQDDPEFTSRSDGYEWYISPNLEVESLKNLNIRLALAKSFNKEAVTNNVLKDGSQVSNAVVPTGLAISTKGTDFRADAGESYDNFVYDVAAAQEYWQKGLDELGVDSLTLEFMCEDSEAIQEVAQFLQSEWQNNLPGLTINLKVEPKKARLEDMGNGNYEIGLTRWGPDYADPMTYIDIWETGSSTNYAKWSNAEYDATIASAKFGDLALDAEARWQALIDCEKMLADDCVIFPVYIQASAKLIKSNISGIHFYSLGIPYILRDVVME